MWLKTKSKIPFSLPSVWKQAFKNPLVSAKAYK